MIIENPDAFKAWMTSVLEPLCDADPEALAKYVYALVKKDKPTDELRKSMIAQLEVFLLKETKGFVDLLFTKLESGLKDDNTYYIKVKDEPLDKVEPGSDEPSLEQPVEVVSTEEVSSSNTDITRPVVTMLDIPEPEKTAVVAPEHKPVVAVHPAKDQAQVQVPGDRDSPRLRNGSFGSVSALPKEGERRLSVTRSHERKSDSEREDKACVRRRGSSGSPPPRRIDRSRSRSWEHRRESRRSRSKSRRSRSRGRERDRSRAWRNKSPPPRGRAYDRDRKMRSWSKSPPLRSRSRSPPSRIRSRYRNRSPLGRSRSRSHSPYGGGTPTQDSNHADDLRLVLGNQNIQSVVNPKKRRCRDFDEKGFCMRGEMCPYDHGKDPVVLEDVGQVLFSAPPPPTGLETPTPTLGVPMLQPAIHPQLLTRPPPNLVEYNPDAPSMEPRMWSKQPFRTAGRGLLRGGSVMRHPGPGFVSHQQRELISVPVMPGEGEEGSFYTPLGNPMKRQCPPEFSNDMDTMSPLKQRFDYTRLGGRRGNCSLQLKKVPSGLNNIAHLHNHFVKFGKIVNIQVCFEGDPEGALITFTSHAEASAAYKSTEAVLNNRFIKVFWHNPDKDNKQENVSPLNRTSAKERLGAPVMNSAPPLNKLDNTNEVEKVLFSGSNITKTVYIPTALDKKLMSKPDPKKMIITTPNLTATNYVNSQEIQIARDSIKKKQEEKRKEALKLTHDLIKKKHDLIERLVTHQKQLIEKLENGNVAAEQRTGILAAINGFQENIDMIRKDMKTVVAKPVVGGGLKVSPQLVKRTREETQKQILDAELDLFNGQQEGKDTADLQKRVLELRSKAHSLGLLNNGVLRLTRGQVTNPVHYRPTRGRGGYNPHSTVDHRPTKLLVSGFESDDKADVLEHFSKFGEVVDHVWDEATPALVIQFKTRKDAETAMAKGRNFQDRLMSVTWFSPAQSMGMRGAGMRSVILLNDNVADLLSEHDEEEEALRINLDSNEDFLLQDEEEEEDEERSWRR